jgi:mannose-6-phosphate isomerase-like protein (cupin superfamily)
MPKVSKESAAQVEQHGPVEDRHEDLDGYTVNFVSFREDIDATPLLRGLPDDSCRCPHWGYVLKGRLTFRFADHEEVFEAGDAFYLPPGHVPSAEAGSEYLQFSPSEELRVVAAAMMRNMQEMQGAGAGQAPG